MKKLLLLLPALALAACAPTVQQEPEYVSAGTVQATCAEALAEVAHRAPSVKPVTPNVDGLVWTFYRVTSANSERVIIESDSALDSSRVVSTWTCAPGENTQVILRSASRGQPATDSNYSFRALFQALKLVR